MVDTRKFAEISLTAKARNGFLKRVRKGAHDDCWPFQGKMSNKGYGIVKSGAHDYVASRIAWFIEHSTQPNGVVCHRCDNPACCNPAHLFVASQSDNLRDMVAKGRCPNGNKTHCKRGHPFTKENIQIMKNRHRRAYRRCLACRRHTNQSRPVIPPEIVQEIKRLRGVTSQTKIATMFGVSPSSVCRLQKPSTPLQGRYWRAVAAGHPKFKPSMERLRRELLP